MSELLVAKSSQWIQPSDNRHEFQTVLVPDGDGGFTACALHYPGVISEGDSFDEAIRNVGEAFLLMLESRRDHGETMMYSDAPVTDVPSNSQVIRVSVHG